MLNYNDLYELLRKEKYSEVLQVLPKNFIDEFSEYIAMQKEQSSQDDSLFSDSVARSKKQFENSIALFKELMLRRKKKLLSLVFVAAETGIMKRDYENMLGFEKEIFDKLVRAFEDGEKELTSLLHGKRAMDKEKQTMIIFTQDVEQFVDMQGKVLGPFTSGQLANLDRQVSELFISSGKARIVDE